MFSSADRVMHELGITSNIVTIVADAAHGRPVRLVVLEVGKLSGVTSDAIAFCFDVVCQGTELEGAKLEIHEIEGRARCCACGAVFDTATLFTLCECGSRKMVLLQGEELTVRSIELLEAS